MNSFDKEHIMLCTLFCIDFIFLFTNQLSILSATNIITVIYGYYLLFKYKSICSVITMVSLCSATCGFIMPGALAFNITSILLTYLSVLLYILFNIKHFNYPKAFRHKYLFIYILLLTCHFIIDFSQAKPLFTKSFLPLIFFYVISTYALEKESKRSSVYLIFFFRITSITSLLIFLLPNYAERTVDILSSGRLYGGIKQEDVILNMLSYLRNNGLYFDPRMFGIYSYIYLYLIIKTNTNNKFDFIISLLCVITSFSRGPIVVYFAILFIFLLIKYRNLFIITFSFIFMLFAVGSFTLGNDVKSYLQTFNVTNKSNALSQREIFRSYSLEHFKKEPILGCGYGYLTARNENKRNIAASDKVSYDIVSDAYLFSTLAEIGLIGFTFFILSLKEIFIKKKDIISYVFYLAFIIHLTGTDIPNMYMKYLVFLIIICYPNLYKK